MSKILIQFLLKKTEAVDEVFKQRGIAEVFEYITKPTFIVASAYGERITSLESKSSRFNRKCTF